MLEDLTLIYGAIMPAYVTKSTSAGLLPTSLPLQHHLAACQVAAMRSGL